MKRGLSALAASAACLLVLLGATAGTNVVRVTKQDTWDGIFNKINRNFASVERLATNLVVGLGAGSDSNVVYFTGSPSNDVNANPFYVASGYPPYPEEGARYTNTAGYYMEFNPGGPTWAMFTPENDGAGSRTGADQSLPVGAWQGDIANGTASYGTNFIHPVYGASQRLVVTNGMVLQFSNGVFIGTSP